ncbi:MAG: flagellar assembly protein FliW [Lachnospiraceae bacterium]|nr:flagellar assembly protein FliW [Lachnospiraceae bacterium]
MQINSRLFGEIDIEDDKIIDFKNGIIGFEEYHKYALIFDAEKESSKSIMWLQSMEEPQLAFPVADPTHIYNGYNPVVEDEWLESIGGIDKPEDVFVLVVLTVPSDLTKMTANLKAPLVINTDTRKGCQIIVNNEEYQVRYNVYDYVQGLKKEEGKC